MSKDEDSPIRNETKKQMEAYLIYVQMGEGRSLEKLSKAAGIPLQTLKRWSTLFGWNTRILKLMDNIRIKVERGIAEKEANILISTTEEFKTGVLGFVDKVMEDAMIRFAEGDLKVKSLNDIASLVKMSLLIRGEATQRVESNVDISAVRDNARKIVAQFASEMSNRPLPIPPESYVPKDEDADDEDFG